MEHCPVITSIDYTFDEPQKIVVAAAQSLVQVDLDGNTRWTHFTAGSLNQCRVGTFQGRETVVCGGFDHSITYLDINGMLTVPRKILKAPIYALETFQDKLLVCSGRTAMIFEPPQKQPIWTKVLPSVIKCAHSSTNSFYIGELNNSIRKFSLEGEMIWGKQLEVSPQDITTYNPNNSDSDVIVGLGNGALLSLSPEGELQWQVNRKWQPILTVNSFQKPDMEERYLLATTIEGSILLFDETGGLISELDIKDPLYASRFNTVNPSEYPFFIGTCKGDVLLIQIN